MRVRFRPSRTPPRQLVWRCSARSRRRHSADRSRVWSRSQWSRLTNSNALLRTWIGGRLCEVSTPDCQRIVQQRACAARDAEPGENSPFGGELLAGQPLYTHAVAVGLRQAGLQGLEFLAAGSVVGPRLTALGGLPPRPRAQQSP